MATHSSSILNVIARTEFEGWKKRVGIIWWCTPLFDFHSPRPKSGIRDAYEYPVEKYPNGNPKTHKVLIQRAMLQRRINICRETPFMKDFVSFLADQTNRFGWVANSILTDGNQVKVLLFQCVDTSLVGSRPPPGIRSLPLKGYRGIKKKLPINQILDEEKPVRLYGGVTGVTILLALYGTCLVNMIGVDPGHLIVVGLTRMRVDMCADYDEVIKPFQGPEIQ